jgi:hypothetical protein
MNAAKAISCADGSVIRLGKVRRPSLSDVSIEHRRRAASDSLAIDY